MRVRVLPCAPIFLTVAALPCYSAKMKTNSLQHLPQLLWFTGVSSRARDVM